MLLSFIHPMIIARSSYHSIYHPHYLLISRWFPTSIGCASQSHNLISRNLTLFHSYILHLPLSVIFLKLYLIILVNALPSYILSAEGQGSSFNAGNSYSSVSQFLHPLL